MGMVLAVMAMGLPVPRTSVKKREGASPDGRDGYGSGRLCA
jgi:hypothetical protein